MNRPSRYHKRIRLDASAYATPNSICFITIAVRDRQPLFANSVIALSAVDTLRERAEKTRVAVYAYCVMPDHVHLVIGPSDTCDVVAFVGQYKNLVQRRVWGHGMAGKIWQKSFWDHFLRSTENLEHTVEYTLNNPVRLGLSDDWRDYPYCGSLYFDHL
jgi:putative transposase